jgi:hypothetical protein
MQGGCCNAANSIQKLFSTLLAFSANAYTASKPIFLNSGDVLD